MNIGNITLMDKARGEGSAKDNVQHMVIYSVPSVQRIDQRLLLAPFYRQDQKGENSLEVTTVVEVNCIENALFLEYIFPHFDVAFGLCYQLQFNLIEFLQ